ncbi:hypothetical protein [Streptomyces platensis]|uniref:hypothetical protein n=1 Tax=Streptomyces platensis TaxID=58346 RepID=UPI002E0FEDC3|nr:hypothetical protein OG229_31745 [Streptomyces platensis]
MDELEYGTVVLRFGRDLPPQVSKVYCKGITLKVPTGRSGADLTIEPSLITTAVSKVDGEAQGTEWWVDRDTTDPNEAVFSFVPDTAAAFDGTWAVSFTLSGIEVNPSIGTVDLDIEELTSTTGAEGSYQKRTGQVKVKKGDDGFYFRSLHPRTVVINRGLTVDLLWEAPADNRIVYTMYYRKADGTEASDSTQANFANRVWKSPALDDNANFTLKATVDGQDYFLTTSLTVNNPNVVVNTLTANETVRTDSIDSKTGSTVGITLKSHVTLGKGWVLRVDDLRCRTDATALEVKSNLTVAAGSTLTTNGSVQANDNVTIKADKTLSTGDVRIDKDRTLKVTWVDPTVTNGTITARGNVNMAAGRNLTIPQGGGQLVVADAFVAKSHNPGSTYPKVEIGAAGVATDGSINLRGAITGGSVTGGSISASSSMKAGGKRVIRNGDRIALQNNVSGTPNFLYHASQAGQWDNVVARPDNRYENNRWYVVSEAGDRASNNAADANEPNVPADPDDDTAGPRTSSA